jgi:predicted GTPase
MSTNQPQPPTIDVQAQSILNGLNTLNELLDMPVAREALDLAQNATTAKRYEILRRLRQSLKQYLERDGDLFYIGFLGHFSSGKSSTINSLLGIWDNPRQRETGLHPTDTTITLITCEKNIKSLLGVIREGHVTIRSQALDTPLLDRLVFVDTPGTGDPHLIQEIARDFLPICDLILFLFSAASPLDQADLPLLFELHKRLPFIPISFVITRADELRIDSAKPVSEANIDLAKTTNFLAKVTSRINPLLSPTVYTDTSFMLVDNKSNYHIDNLRTFLLAHCNPSNPHARISMHANKMHFYLSGAKDLRDFFGAFLDGKLVELNKIVTAADRNIKTYNEIVRISNNNLTKAWLDQHTAVSDARTRTFDRIKPLGALPADYSTFGSVVNRQTQIATEIIRDAQYVAAHVSAQLTQQVVAPIGQRLHNSEMTIEQIGLDALTPSSHGISIAQISWNLEKTELIPDTLLMRKSDELRMSQADALQDAAADLRRMAEETEKLVQKRSPLTECEVVMKNAQESLITDLNQFFRNVELYRDGVFSHTTKESIATLGIGRQLDALESEFNDDDKSGFAADARRDIFPGFDELTTSVVTQLASLSAKLRVLVESLKTLKLSRPEASRDAIGAAIDAATVSLTVELKQELQADSDRLSAKVAAAVGGLIAGTKADYDATMKGATKERRNRYLGITSVAGIIALAFYVGFHYLTQPPPQTRFSTIAWAVLANVIGDIVGIVVARLRDRFPDTARKIRERFNAMLRTNVRKLIDSELKAFEFTTVNERALTHRLTQLYQRIVMADAEAWRPQATEYFRQLKGLQIEYGAVRSSYVAVIDNISRHCAGYFSDASRNLNILNSVAGRIKERAIEPSFQLLAETRRQLENVKKDIEAVDFT